MILFTVHLHPSESIDCDKEPYHEVGRLKKFLLCGSYDANQRPVKDMKFAVNVSVLPILMSFEYVSIKG